MTTFNIEKYNTDDFNATYSPEDNKLRLYTNVRIDKEDWLLMKNNGWKYAPKQELFVCYWSVNNEDFCLALAGDILPEEMTMVERAEAKADRLLLLAKKRSTQCVGYQQAANDLMLRLDNNQPILNGHHSQRKAEKTQLQIERSIEKAKDTHQAVGYWVWRAKGVIGHADYKNNTRTIYNRIKTLLKDLRDKQRVINDADHKVNTIIRVESNTTEEMKAKNTKWLCGEYSVSKFNLNEKIESGDLTVDQALTELKQIYNNTVNSVKRARVINHILNRLAYEQGQLSIVSIYDGVITAPVIQTFLRTHGADKPKATKGDSNNWIVESAVHLPLHIGNGLTMELEDHEWCELMQSVGYEVPVKKVTAPILNFKTELPLQHKKLYDLGNELLEQKVMTKAEYNKVNKDRRYTRKSACGEFRFKTVNLVNEGGRGYWDTTEYAVFISDSKAHATPESMQAVEG